MYIMKRTDLVFKAGGTKVRSTLEELKLNEVMDLQGGKKNIYRLLKGKDFYEVEERDWRKIEELYLEIVGKNIPKTKSYEVPCKNSTTACYINEDDYCSLVKKIDLEKYSPGLEPSYLYYVETKSLITRTDMKFEVEEEVYKMIEEMNN